MSEPMTPKQRARKALDQLQAWRDTSAVAGAHGVRAFDFGYAVETLRAIADEDASPAGGSATGNDSEAAEATPGRPASPAQPQGPQTPSGEGAE